MKVYLGSDHAGFPLKEAVKAFLADRGHEIVDCGALAIDPTDDYPAFCFAAAERAVADGDTGKSLAIVFGGSGNGEAMAANKVTGARCALAHSDDTARLARAHNDANVLALGARTIPEEDAIRFADIFVSTPFSREERHRRRIGQLAEYEASRA